jgi:hypothetical protein
MGLFIIDMIGRDRVTFKTYKISEVDTVHSLYAYIYIVLISFVNTDTVYTVYLYMHIYICMVVLLIMN